MVNMKFPAIVEFEDYHDIYWFGDKYQKADSQIGYFECSPEDYGFEFNQDYAGTMCYYGVFYKKGAKPTKKQVVAMLDKQLPESWVRS